MPRLPGYRGSPTDLSDFHEQINGIALIVLVTEGKCCLINSCLRVPS